MYEATSGAAFSKLESAAFAGGRITASEGSNGAIYTAMNYVTDHLGSTRVVVNASNGEVSSRNDYYAFGSRWSSGDQAISDNRYLYNGKESQSFANIDYGARMYDPELGRWFNNDPLAEKYYTMSPYVYCANNPIRFVDPDGRKIKIANNTEGAINNIAQIVATSLGAQIMNNLVNSPHTYTMGAIFRSSKSWYNPSNREIEYGENTWNNTSDGGSTSSMLLMAHESMHAYDHNVVNFNIRNFAALRTPLEQRAVSFGNYLRAAYSLFPMRNAYTPLTKENLYQFSASQDIISDFQ